MSRFICLNQLRAQEILIQSYKDKRAVLLSGAPRSGKTTIAKTLAKNSHVLPGKSIFIDSCTAIGHLTVQHVFAAALGLPHRAGSLPQQVFFEVIADIVPDTSEWALIIDDINLLLKANFIKADDAVSFLAAMFARFEGMKLIGTTVNSFATFIPLAATGVSVPLAPVTHIFAWADTAEFREFVIQIAAYHGFRSDSMASETFLRALLARTRGATGSIVECLRVLALNSGSLSVDSFSPKALDNLWKFRFV